MKQPLHSNKCKQFESNLISAINKLQHFARSRQFLTGLSPHDLAERFSRTPTNMSTNLQRSIPLNGRVTSRRVAWHTTPVCCLDWSHPIISYLGDKPIVLWVLHSKQTGHRLFHHPGMQLSSSRLERAHEKVRQTTAEKKQCQK